MKELLFSITKKDFKIDYFSGTGAGGQHRNKHQNCVRLCHKDSGVTVTGQSSKQRTSNLREAFRSLTEHPRFKLWRTRKTHEVITGKSIADRVEEMVRPENLKIEHQNEQGEWETCRTP